MTIIKEICICGQSVPRGAAEEIRKVNSTDGQLQFDFTEKVNFQTLTSLFKDGGEVTTTMKELFTNDSGIDINREVLDKLSSSCDISISIPEIDMPEINLPLGRAA